jgi:hypothetical protein
MPYFVSIIWGVVTAVILGVCTPLVMLGEMGGPIDFTAPFLFVVFVVLAIACYTSRVKGGLRGSACGVLFASPVSLVCLIISRSDDILRREHGAQLFAVAGMSLVVSLAVMAAVAHSRSLPKI